MNTKDQSERKSIEPLTTLHFLDCASLSEVDKLLYSPNRFYGTTSSAKLDKLKKSPDKFTGARTGQHDKNTLEAMPKAQA